MNKIRYFRLLRLVSLIIILTLIFYLLKYLFIYLLPFIIALVIASILDRIVCKIEEKWKRSRTLITTIITLFFFSITGIVLYVFIYLFIQEITDLFENLPTYFVHLNDLLKQSYAFPLRQFNIEIDSLMIEQLIDELLDQLAQYSSTILTSIINLVSNAITSITFTITFFIVLILSTFMITKDYHLFKQFLVQELPNKLYRFFVQLSFQFKKTVIRLLWAQLLLAFIASCIALLGFIIIDLDHKFILTLCIIIVDLLPYIGVGIVFLPLLFYHFMTANYLLTIELSVIYSIIIIVRQIIEPKIIANHIGIHPLLALIILYLSIVMFGFSGLLFSPILLITVATMKQANIFTLLKKYIWEG